MPITNPARLIRLARALLIAHLMLAWGWAGTDRDLEASRSG
jgi:hypothetical protein